MVVECCTKKWLYHDALYNKIPFFSFLMTEQYKFKGYTYLSTLIIDICNKKNQTETNNTSI